MHSAIFRSFLFIAVLAASFSFASAQPAAQTSPVDLSTVLARKLAAARKTVLTGEKLVVKTGSATERTDFGPGFSLDEVCDLSDSVSNRIFREYGAMFVGESDVFAGFLAVFSKNRLRPVVNCVFEDSAAVDLYQRSVRETGGTKTLTIGTTTIELQAKAMDALLGAIEDARRHNLQITPRGGSLAARRSYDDTKRFWDSRFLPALNYWIGKGRITREQAEEVKKLDVRKQVERVLEWEHEGIFFSRDLSKSILYSVAAPGASQHIFMLALDVEQFASREVREILAKHGWYQTVYSDLPHFTYLGVEESRLPELGLEARFSGSHKFWVPRVK